MNNLYYEISEDGSVLIFDGVNELPFLKQPNWPAGQAWGKGEAKSWAEQFILAMTDETADFAGNSPDEPIISRPTITE